MDSHGDSSDRQSSEQTQPIKRFGWRQAEIGNRQQVHETVC